MALFEVGEFAKTICEIQLEMITIWEDVQVIRQLRDLRVSLEMQEPSTQIEGTSRAEEWTSDPPAKMRSGW